MIIDSSRDRSLHLVQRSDRTLAYQGMPTMAFQSAKPLVEALSGVVNCS